MHPLISLLCDLQETPNPNLSFLICKTVDYNPVLPNLVNMLCRNTTKITYVKVLENGNWYTKHKLLFIIEV